jgi:hypothetical protein
MVSSADASSGIKIEHVPERVRVPGGRLSGSEKGRAQSLENDVWIDKRKPHDPARTKQLPEFLSDDRREGRSEWLQSLR